MAKKMFLLSEWRFDEGLETYDGGKAIAIFEHEVQANAAAEYLELKYPRIKLSDPEYDVDQILYSPTLDEVVAAVGRER